MSDGTDQERRGDAMSIFKSLFKQHKTSEPTLPTIPEPVDVTPPPVKVDPTETTPNKRKKRGSVATQQDLGQLNVREEKLGT